MFFVFNLLLMLQVGPKMTRIRDIVGPFFHVAVCIHHVYAIFYSNKPKDFSQVTDERILNMERFAPVYFTSWNMVSKNQLSQVLVHFFK